MMSRQRIAYLLASLLVIGLVVELIPSRADEIHTAVQQNNLDQVKKICAKNPKAAGAAAKDNNNYTPLHFAVFQGQKPVLEELLKHKPDVNAKDAAGYTPLYHAVTNYRLDMIDALLEAGADIMAASNDKQTPLQAALQNRYGNNNNNDI